MSQKKPIVFLESRAAGSVPRMRKAFVFGERHASAVRRHPGRRTHARRPEESGNHRQQGEAKIMEQDLPEVPA